MNEDLINFELPVNKSSIIKVIGVGGGGSNAVNYMYRRGIKDVNFVICNTDSQALEASPVPVKIKLGQTLTEGRGAGNDPNVGKQAAIENLNDIIEILSANTKMVFITAGMGGGTGTGAAPVIAKAAKELNILTVAIVTIPFRNEGPKRNKQAIEGIAELEKHVDSLLIINNEKLRETYGNFKISEAFARADDVLATAAKGIAEIITVTGYVNVDFADVYAVMAKSGVAIMGAGMATGENRAMKAIQQALSSPLLNNNEIKGAANILLNITYGTEEITLDEIGEITDYITNEVGSMIDIIWGVGLDEKLGDNISVTIIATGFKSNSIPELYRLNHNVEKVTLDGRKYIPADQPVIVAKKPETEPANLRQGVIEFDIREMQATKTSEENRLYAASTDITKAGERIKKIKETREQLKGTVITPPYRNANIEELESIPAYKRKNIKLEDAAPSNDIPVSRFSLQTGEDKTVTLKTNNSYLHDNVD